MRLSLLSLLLSEQTLPLDNLACYWDIRQGTNKQTQLVLKSEARLENMMHSCGCGTGVVLVTSKSA